MRSTASARRSLTWVLACVLLAFVVPAVAQQATGAAGAAGGGRYKLVRSVSGAKASLQAGRLVVEDPRTVFYLSDDKELVFYFEWEGPPASHRLEGVWIDPTGKVASVSAFDYEAKDRRFGGQWTLPVSPGMTLGTWTFEARVDGEAAGRHAFQIMEGERPASLAVARRAWSAADAYRRLQAAMVLVEAVDGAGGVVACGLGFAVSAGQILTAFETVDGATLVRLRFPDGHSVDARHLSAFHRWQDWAIIPASTGDLPILSKAPGRAWQVGDRVYSLALSGDGGLSIVDAGITGTARPESAGERLTLAAPGLARSPGAPVVDEYGDVIAMVADQTVPGASTLPRPMNGPSATEDPSVRAGVYAVPIDQVQAAPEGAAPRFFTQLANEGVFTVRLGAGRVHVVRGTTSENVRKDSGWFDPIAETAVFPRGAEAFSVVLNLRPQAKLRASANCQLLDKEGRKLGEGRPIAVKADANQGSSYTWRIPLTGVAVGIYRVDIVLDGVPVWRTFVKITA
jgi:S1-C subfamily serine protease